MSIKAGTPVLVLCQTSHILNREREGEAMLPVAKRSIGTRVAVWNGAGMEAVIDCGLATNGELKYIDGEKGELGGSDV